MKALYVFMLLCGLIIIAVKVFEIATGSLKNPTLIVLGPFMVIVSAICLMFPKTHK